MRPTGRIKVVIIDRYPVVRYGIRSILEREGNVDIVADVESAADALSHVRNLDSCIVVGEVLVKSAGSDDGSKALSELEHVTRVAVSSAEDWDSVQKFFKSGGRGYVAKRSPVEQVAAAVHAVASGGQYVSPTLRQHQPSPAGQSLSEEHVLSGREAEVLGLIADGMTSVEIADLLCISRRTVDTHRHRICRKLNVSSRSQLVRYAQTAGLVHRPRDAQA